MLDSGLWSTVNSPEGRGKNSMGPEGVGFKTECGNSKENALPEKRNLWSLEKDTCPLISWIYIRTSGIQTEVGSQDERIEKERCIQIATTSTTDWLRSNIVMQCMRKIWYMRLKIQLSKKRSTTNARYQMYPNLLISAHSYEFLRKKLPHMGVHFLRKQTHLYIIMREYIRDAMRFQDKKQRKEMPMLIWYDCIHGDQVNLMPRHKQQVKELLPWNGVSTTQKGVESAPDRCAFNRSLQKDLRFDIGDKLSAPTCGVIQKGSGRCKENGPREWDPWHHNPGRQVPVENGKHIRTKTVKASTDVQIRKRVEHSSQQNKFPVFVSSRVTKISGIEVCKVDDPRKVQTVRDL